MKQVMLKSKLMGDINPKYGGGLVSTARREGSHNEAANQYKEEAEVEIQR
jgi:hypothetical protein